MKLMDPTQNVSSLQWVSDSNFAEKGEDFMELS